MEARLGTALVGRALSGATMQCFGGGISPGEYNIKTEAGSANTRVADAVFVNRIGYRFLDTSKT